MTGKALEESEVGQLLVSALGVRPHTKKELFDIVKWAEGVKTSGTLLELVFEGKLRIEWVDGQPAFSTKEFNKTKQK